MKLASFLKDEKPRIGAEAGEWMVDLNNAYRASLPDMPIRRMAHQANYRLPGCMRSFLETGELGMDAARLALQYVTERLGKPRDMTRFKKADIIHPISETHWLPVVTDPRKFFCIGKNYVEHAEEMGGSAPPWPEIFTRFNHTLIAHNAPIVKPSVTAAWDYEGEMAVIIGKRARRVSRERALEYVAGYSCFNDVSARDFQRRATQWTAGKNFDGSGPFGAWLVTADEAGDPQNHAIRLKIGDTILQESNTSKMIYPVDDLIARISEFATLEPGDVIATGTPSGVGAARNPQRWLKPGDIVRIEVDGICALENPVVREDDPTQI